VTPKKLSNPQTYLQNKHSHRLEIWHTDAYGQFLPNARIEIEKGARSRSRDPYKFCHTVKHISKTNKATD